ncbi:MAG TPA: glucokinase [Thermoanaerobaculia bacterium]|nr:glucokinase [Thermoanaerobaculia bacterium]
MTRILAADVGGTKCLLEVLELEGTRWKPAMARRYQSELYPSFESLLREFVGTAGAVDYGCLAVAGPVVDGRAKVTNLTWEIDAAGLARAFGIRQLLLVNDFYAVAAGVPHLEAADVELLLDRPRNPAGPIAILGAGTGLGEAIVVPERGGWTVIPSEGGHTDFAPANGVQDGLLAHLRARFGHVSWERVVSGMGLVNIFTYLRDTDPALATADFSGGTTDSDDLPALIAKKDREGNPLARATFDLFLDAYGAEAGNLALKCLASGGVFLAGGIGAKNAERMRDPRFLAAYGAKGRHSELVMQWPVHLITNDRVGLIGAASLAARLAS